ncbi:ClpP/crotonase [Atractiella rhizophila]|nr:ClpP/crotonase [Atractiella rhizophila]
MEPITFPRSSPTPLITLTRPQPTIFLLTLNYSAHGKVFDNRLTPQFVNESFLPALDEIERIWRSAEWGSKDRRAAVVTVGNGRFYSNGLDFPAGFANPRLMQDVFFPLMIRLLTFPLPTIACITGHAFAGGMMLALAHDYRVFKHVEAAKGASFMCMNEVDLGIPLIGGMMELLRHKMSLSTLRNVVLQGHRFTATEALKHELVDTIVPCLPSDDAVGKMLPVAFQLADKAAVKAEKGVLGVLKVRVEPLSSSCLFSILQSFCSLWGFWVRI